MKLTALLKRLDAKILYEGNEAGDVSGGYTSDLLSDVMAHAEEGSILITIQAHKNTVAVAVLKDLAAILVCSNRPVDEDMLEAARE